MGASASKIKFRESLTSLTTRDVSASDAEFWDELWKIPSSSEEVFELLTPASARRLRDDRFDNLATLFTQATAQLCQIVETPYTIYFDQALNCVRVLTRVVPFLLEKGDLGENDPNVELLCWGEKSSAAVSATAAGGMGSVHGGSSSRGGGRGGGRGHQCREEKSHPRPPRNDKENKKSTKRNSNKVQTRKSEGERLRKGRGDMPKLTVSATMEEEDLDNDVHNLKTAKARGSSVSPTPKATRKGARAVAVWSDSEEEEREVGVCGTSDDDEEDDDDDDGDYETSDLEEERDDEVSDDESSEDVTYETKSTFGGGIINGVDDDSEPLALLVVHAAMHMLFLPQFTCEFYEEDVVGTLYDEEYDPSDDDDLEEENENGEDPLRSQMLDMEGRIEAGLGHRPRKITNSGGGGFDWHQDRRVSFGRMVWDILPMGTVMWVYL